MENDALVFTIFLIFTGAAVVSTMVLYTRQSLLVAYILLGMFLGPWGLKWVPTSSVVSQVGNFGIIFLLFLMGLHLQPQKLLHMLRKVTWVALLSSLVFLGSVFLVCYFSGYSNNESLIIAAAMIFSSTIIGMKLLPTTILHHQHTGELMISVLLMQDLIAIIVMLVLQGSGTDGFSWRDAGVIILALPALIGISFLFTKFIILKLLARFDRTQEYVFILSIAWCLSMAMLAEYVGLSEDIGAFIAGVALASNPISLYIAESLKPLRDFFLVLFFFAVGASFNFEYLHLVIVTASILAVMLLLLKPFLFKILLRGIGEKKSVSKEVGWRLGQASEFSILVSTIALQSGLIRPQASNLILAATILTFVVSSYVIVLRYPTPIGLTEKMRRD